MSAIHQVLGDAFDTLPDEVRHAHDHPGILTLKGLARSEIGKGALRWLVCAAIGLPRHGADQPVTILLRTGASGVDFWRRDFSGRRYRSRLGLGRGRCAGLLVERQGALTNVFALSVQADRIVFELKSFALLGIPLPRFISPRCTAHETAEHGRFVFDIAIELPLLGRLIHYRGALVPA